jgi:hypothetical protein
LWHASLAFVTQQPCCHIGDANKCWTWVQDFWGQTPLHLLCIHVAKAYTLENAPANLLNRLAHVMLFMLSAGAIPEIPNLSGEPASAVAKSFPLTCKAFQAAQAAAAGHAELDPEAAEEEVDDGAGTNGHSEAAQLSTRAVSADASPAGDSPDAEVTAGDGASADESALQEAPEEARGSSTEQDVVSADAALRSPNSVEGKATESQAGDEGEERSAGLVEAEAEDAAETADAQEPGQEVVPDEEEEQDACEVQELETPGPARAE